MHIAHRSCWQLLSAIHLLDLKRRVFTSNTLEGLGCGFKYEIGFSVSQEIAKPRCSNDMTRCFQFARYNQRFVGKTLLLLQTWSLSSHCHVGWFLIVGQPAGFPPSVVFVAGIVIDKAPLLLLLRAWCCRHGVCGFSLPFHKGQTI